MVLLRLEVRVYPREPVSTTSAARASRLIGNGRDGRNPETNQEPTTETSSGKPYASFLMLLRNTEDITLKELAAKIVDEWASFRPDQEHLEIKKLLDDANPTVDLNPSMTVADIFLDIGKARADGHDQRAIVRVVQKPTPGYYQRFTSVERDWNTSSATDWRQQKYRDKRNTATRFSPIAEEQRPRDAPLPSVENETISGTPPLRSLGSEELGDSYSPQEQNRESKKRKTSTEPSGPAKHRRLEEEQPTPSSVSPQRKRTNVPTFASPHRRPSLTERTAPNENIGLGVTKSPLSKKQSNISSSQNTVPISTPQSAGKYLHSAMRKSSPITANSQQRRSVSFNEPIAKGEAHSTPRVESSQKSQKKATHKGQKPASSDAQESPYTPSNRNTMTPDQQQRKQMDDQFARIKQALEAKEKAKLKADLENPDINTASKIIIQRLLKIFESIDDAKKNTKGIDGNEDNSRLISNLQRKLPSLRNKLAESLGNKSAEKARKPAASQPENEPTLPVSDATVNRSIPSAVAAPSTAPAASQPETWSFGSIAPPSTRKQESQSQPTPTRRMTRSSASASQELMPQKSPSKSPAPRQSSPPSAPKSNRVDPQDLPKDSNADVQEETEPSHPKDVQQNDVEMEDAGSDEDSSEGDSSEEGSSDESVNDGETSAEMPKADEQIDEDNSDQANMDGSDEQTESKSPAMANGLVDDAAKEDSKEDNEEQEEAEEDDDEMKDFIDDGSERTDESEGSGESEEEQAEDEDSGEVAKAKAADAQEAEEQVEESDNNEEDEAQDEAQADAQADESQAVEGDHDKKNQPESPPEENDDSQYESLENSDESDSEIDLPAARKSDNKSPNNGTPNASGFQSTQQLASSQAETAPKTTLKSLLQAAKQESNRQKSSPVAPATTTANPKSKPTSVWEVPSSDDSDDSDDSEQGDILPSGDSRRPRMPYSQRG